MEQSGQNSKKDAMYIFNTAEKTSSNSCLNNTVLVFYMCFRIKLNNKYISGTKISFFHNLHNLCVFVFSQSFT